MSRVLVVLLLLVIGCNDNNGPAPDTTRPPDVRTPDARAEGPRPDACVSTNPVKILFVVDTSRSMQLADPKIKRQAAVRQLRDALISKLNVSFAVLQFNARIVVNGSGTSPAAFTRDPTLLDTVIGGLAQADILSDLQSALTTAANLLADDMKSAASVAKTRYAVILLSDGGTAPLCTAGCENDRLNMLTVGECAGGACGIPSTPGRGSPDGGWTNIKSWCDIPRDQWCDFYNPTSCDDMLKWFPWITAPCLEWNSEQLLVSKVKALTALKSQGAGAVELHAVRLLDPAAPGDALKMMGIEAAKTEPFLRKLATEGSGAYLDLYGSSADLLQLPLQPLCP